MVWGAKGSVKNSQNSQNLAWGMKLSIATLFRHAVDAAGT
jgi:hypothetical protein